MALPRGIYVVHLNGNGLDNRKENLLRVQGIPDPRVLPGLVAAADDERGGRIYMHDLIMEGMIERGHPNARLPDKYGRLIG